MNVWTGKKVRLRAWEPGDWQAQRRWRADTDGERATFMIPFPQSDESMRRETEEYALQRPDKDNLRLIIEALDSGDVVGTMSTESDPVNGTFSYGLYVAPEYRRNGYASDAVIVLVRFFFEERRYQKVNVGTSAYNEASIALHEKLGFKLEGRQRRMQFANGAYHDLVWYGMTVEEFRERYVKK